MDAHGHLSLSWCDDVLTVKAYGPFNQEGAEQARLDYINAVAQKKTTVSLFWKFSTKKKLGRT